MDKIHKLMFQLNGVCYGNVVYYMKMLRVEPER